jgi:IMP cyclohydrolase
MIDPSLIIYHPVRVYDGHIIVTNGDQTDTIKDNMLAENSFHAALLRREFEPDTPNYTPRISGVVLPDGSYKLSIIKSLDGNPTCCCRNFFEYDKAIAGTGHFIHTYKSDGNPLPSFDGEPKPVAVTGSLEEFANGIWHALNAENKVSLYGYSKDIQTGAVESILFNKNR